MTKPTIQSLKKENDGLKNKLETLTKELKELLMKKESTARTSQDGGSSSPNHELESSIQFLSDEYDDLQDSHSATLRKFSKLGKDLSDISAKVMEVSTAAEALQQYSYQYNLKIVGYPQANETESSQDTAKLCLHLFSCLGVNGITPNDIDIAHCIPIRASAVVNKPKPIICKFTRRSAKEKVMAARRASFDISLEDLGPPNDVSFERIGIYDHLTPKLQELLHSANNFKTQHGYKFCWAKNGVVFLCQNETSRPIKVTLMDDLIILTPQSYGSTHQKDE